MSTMGIKKSLNGDDVSNLEYLLSSVKVKTGLCHVNPQSNKGRRVQMCRMISIPMVPSLLLLTLATISLFQAVEVEIRLNQSRRNIEKGHDIAGLVHQLQQERIEVTFFAIKNRSIVDLTGVFLITDEIINSLDWPENQNTEEGFIKMSKESFTRTLAAARYSNDFAAELETYSELNSASISWLISTVQDNSDDTFWEALISYVSFVRAKENMGIYATIAAEFFVLRHLPRRDFIQYVENLYLSKDHLDVAFQYSTHLQESYNDTIERHKMKFTRLHELEDVILNDGDLDWNTSIDYSQLWIVIVEDILDLLKDLEDDLEEQIFKLVAEGFTVASVQINAYVITIICVIVIIPLISYISWRVTTSMQNFALGLENKTQQLHQEKKRSDSLLYRMLPRSVAMQLKSDSEVRAESYEAVTIYFSDIVGFTVLSSRSSPMQVVRLLNELYNLFDSRIEQYDVYKVETIGDSYMVASGLPNRNGDRHAVEIANLALDLMERLRYFQVPHRPEERLQLRVGLHTGACAAGVVGSKMPRYCLFGDTVNTASRMESHSEPMKIHISDNCKKFLEKNGNYRIVPRGSIEIKGKGVMDTFWLEECLELVNGRQSVSPVWKTLAPSRNRSKDYT